MSTAHGIFTIDTAFQRAHFDAAYLVVESGRAAFIDCGTNYSVPAMLAMLAAQELQPGDVDWLLLTHVHLDHAGGAGLLMRHLPNARLVVHPRGARHMIDPTRLVAGATAVYGEAEIARSYGMIQPVPAARVVVAEDGHVVDLAGRPLLCIDTPGHARHHFCIWDERSRSWFSGDTFGLSYREFDVDGRPFVIPTTSPVQFDPPALKTSIRRLLAKSPAAMYLTHYDRVGDVARLGAELIEQVDAMVAIAEAAEGACVAAGADGSRDTGDRATRHRRLHDALRTLYVERARRHGVAAPETTVPAVLGMDIELNAQGLGVWLDQRRQVAAEPV